MHTAYLMMKLQHDGAKGVPKIVDVLVYTEPHPSMLGFEFSYAELSRASGQTLEIAMRSLVEHARHWPYLHWVFAMPGMQ